MKLDLEAIERRCEKAYPPPWRLKTESASNFVWILSDAKPEAALICDEIDLNDAEFIAHARTDIPALVAEVDRLRGIIEDLEPEATIHLFDIGGEEMAGPMKKRIREALGEG